MSDDRTLIERIEAGALVDREVVVREQEWVRSLMAAHEELFDLLHYAPESFSDYVSDLETMHNVNYAHFDRILREIEDEECKARLAAATE